ncbi:MAG: hypothetical protein AB1724_09250 [Thermodesulfobacteriota bacterium]
MPRKSQPVFLIFFLIMLLFGCSKSSQSPSDYSDSLIILNGASNVRYEKLNGTDQVYYKVYAEYPANENIAELNRRLDAKGWKQLKTDWLNPEIPTSHVRGWTDFVDGTTKPNQKVYSWNSDWTNSNEDMLIFTLRYSHPLEETPNRNELNVIGIFIAEKLAKQTLKNVK